MDELTERVLAYQKSGEGKKGLMDELMEFVYTYDGRGLSVLEEERSGFLLDFYPKIESLLEKFIYKGFSFKTFLVNSLMWHKKSLLQKREKSYYFEQAMAMECTHEYLERSQESPEYPEILQDSDISISIPSAHREGLLCQFLFNSSSLNDDEIAHFASRFQFDAEVLQKYVQKIHHITDTREKRYREIIIRKNTLYMAKKAAEIRLRRAIDSSERDDIQKKISALEKKITLIRSKISEKVPHPTHKELADVLKIPRGTVSSRLYRIRKGIPGLYYLLQKEYVMRHEDYSSHK